MQGGETVIYEELTGSYNKTGALMDEIYYDLKDNYDIKTTKGIGLYIDNPEQVETSKLRSEAGCIINEEDLEKLEELSGKYKKKVLPKQKYIVTEFPYKGMMSVIVSVMKIYPALAEYSKENAYNENTPVMEIYDIPNKKIYYRKELKK